jgi:hypothetical protein
MKQTFRIIFILFLILQFRDSFCQDIDNQGLYLYLIKKDTVIVDIVNSAEYFKKLDYKYDSDTLVLVVKIGLSGLKNFSNRIPLLPNINFIRLNNTKYFIKFNNQTNSWYLDEYNLIKLN